jgi:hypothetical protein
MDIMYILYIKEKGYGKGYLKNRQGKNKQITLIYSRFSMGHLKTFYHPFL